MRRKWVWLGVGALVVLGGGGTAAYVVLRDHQTPVSVEKAKQRFPGASVYSMATTGTERIHSPSSTHRYPAESPLAITTTACGETLRWQPTEARYDLRTWCREGGGIAERSLTSLHTFFGVGVTRTYTCGAGAYVLPPDPHAGATWTFTCHGGKAGETVAGTVVGDETRAVGSTQVATVHVRLVTTFSGSVHGTETADLWLRPSDGLPVAMTRKSDSAEKAVFGSTRYSEDVSLVMKDVQPSA